MTRSTIAEVTPQTKFSIYWLISDSWLMAKRSITHIIRSMDQLVGLIMFPVMFTLLNKYVLGGAIAKSLPSNISYVNFLFAGVFIQTLAFGANSTTINLAADLKEGITDRFRSLPMSNSALIIGHIIADLVRNILSGAIIIVVALIIGFRPDASFIEWLQIIGLAMLFTLAISWMSAILGLMVKTLEAAQWFGFVVIFPLTFISSAFVPTDTMPAGLRAFAENQPLTKVMNAIRGLTLGQATGNAITLSIIWCVGLIVFAVPVTTFMFKRRSQKG
ncbi:MAG: ABC transporter permease [Acidimicrobiia bacterium]|nr:ABC transporter permease [Acidimicrobiia bacterium]